MTNQADQLTIVPIACPGPGCGVFIATAILVDAVWFLHVPPFKIVEGDSRCCVCGRVFYWNGRRETTSGIHAMHYQPVDK